MVDQLDLGREHFVAIEQIDEAIACNVAAARCPVCGGPLHRGDYDRKPRGGSIAPWGERSMRRFSLCCGREGCRKRALPPSLRFLGRRVYLGVVVIVASLIAQEIARTTAISRAAITLPAITPAGAIQQRTGVPARTVDRWLAWWRGPFTRTEVLVAVRAHLVGLDTAALPASIVDRLDGSLTERVRRLVVLLAPLTTSSVRDGSRFVRDIA